MTGRDGSPGDGDGWVVCSAGHRHWGRCGAAGLLLHRPGGAGGSGPELLLQHRAEWSHHGGTWGLLGGARRPAEAAVAAAVREAGEESGLRPESVQVRGLYDDEHGGWSYTSVVAAAVGDVDARATSGESIEVAWWPVDGLGDLPLHPGFAQTWPALRAALDPLTVVVDAANVVGSRPDGWWKDRVGATRRLVQHVAALDAAGVPDADLPPQLTRAGLRHWWPTWVVVVEGAARAAVDAAAGGSARVVVTAAAGSGDEAVVAAVAAAGPGPRLVVTADRELRRRCEAGGAAVTGPRWLTGLGPPDSGPSGSGGSGG